MTIKATFPDGTVMMLGDSYRKWWDQLAELCHYRKLPRPTVMKCPTRWISYGGLKWCAESEFVECLKEEGQGRTVDYFAKWSPLNQIERRTIETHGREFPLNAHSLLHGGAGVSDEGTNGKGAIL